VYRSPRVSSVTSLILASAAVTAAPGVQAQESTQSQASAGNLQEVVVTAQKREERLHDVPMGVTAITAEDLQKQQLVSLDDLASKVPGLSLTDVQPGITRLTLRGQDAGGVGSTVTTYIDDTPFGSSNGARQRLWFHR
jgi:iron complex outermembrane receptor protein